jgi:two-component sensor histidine kinase/integral membrane sensor domain MASE1
VGAGYFAVAYLGLQLASINPSTTPIWPATGVAIAAVLLWGYRAAAPIFIAAFLVNFLTAGSPFTSGLIALGNTTEAAATAYLMRRWAAGDHAFESAAAVGKFALICMVTTTISATIGVAALVAGGFAELGSAAPVWLTWWLGDLAGAVVITPVALLWLSGDDSGLPSAASTCAGAYLVAAVVGLVAFSPLFPQTPLRDPLGFFAVVPLLWAALRCGPRETASIAAILAGFAVWGTMMQGGPFGRATLNESFLLLLMFVISTSIPSLALSADIRARQRTQQYQQLLLKELSHRVGNTLAVVGSVFRRSARHAKTINELEYAFQSRLMNLAATHRLLGEANWESASIKELIKAAVEPYCPPDYDECEFSGDDVRIAGQMVTSLTMVLHELASNAAKHGALKANGGKLKVVCALKEMSLGRELVIDWQEVGVQSRSTSDGPGYGTTLINETISALRGRVEWIQQDGLFEVGISVPLN